MNALNKSARILSICIVWLAAVEPTVHAETGKLLALLIGNGDYKDGRLISGRANVIAMEPVLEQIGFEATVVPDANLEKMRGELESFEARIAGASVVLFFYSGHGGCAPAQGPACGSRAEKRSKLAWYLSGGRASSAVAALPSALELHDGSTTIELDAAPESESPNREATSRCVRPSSSESATA